MSQEKSNGERAPNRLAEALRELRQRDGLTLADVSERTGLSISALSKVENGQMSLTYDKLASLSSGMGVDITFFFKSHTDSPPDKPVTARRTITRRGEGDLMQTKFYDYLYPCTDLSDRRLMPMIGTLKARTLEEYGGMTAHTGEEFTMVLEGKVDVRTEFYSPAILEVGDCIYFDSTMAHAYLAADDGPCRILCVTNAPEVDLHLKMREFNEGDDASSGDWTQALLGEKA